MSVLVLRPRCPLVARVQSFGFIRRFDRRALQCGTQLSVRSIDVLTPKGSKSVADNLRAIIDENAKSPDKDKAAGDNSLKQVMYRLEARGG